MHYLLNFARKTYYSIKRVLLLCRAAEAGYVEAVMDGTGSQCLSRDGRYAVLESSPPLILICQSGIPSGLLLSGTCLLQHYFVAHLAPHDTSAFHLYAYFFARLLRPPIHRLPESAQPQPPTVQQFYS